MTKGTGTLTETHQELQPGVVQAPRVFQGRRKGGEDALCARCRGGRRAGGHPETLREEVTHPKPRGGKRAALEAGPALPIGLTGGCFRIRKCWGLGGD